MLEKFDHVYSLYIYPAPQALQDIVYKISFL